MRRETNDQRLKTDDLRKKHRSLFFVISLLGLWSLVFGLQSVFAADPATRFKEAADLYKTGKYEEAGKIYEELLPASTENERAALYFNLANSRYRTGKVSEAIWDYERALAMNPWYADARYNLNSVKSKLEYKIEDRRNFFIRFNDFALKWLKASQLTVLALLFSLMFLFSTWLWLRQQNGRQFWSFPRAECLVLFCFFAFFAGAKIYYQQNFIEAIVLVPEAEVRYGPSADNQSLMKLGGGLKVYIVDDRDDWSRVVTWNGETGWMRNSEMGRIDS